MIMVTITPVSIKWTPMIMAATKPKFMTLWAIMAVKTLAMIRTIIPPKCTRRKPMVIASTKPKCTRRKPMVIATTKPKCTRRKPMIIASTKPKCMRRKPMVMATTKSMFATLQEIMTITIIIMIILMTHDHISDGTIASRPMGR
ncbi:uncharacterized protein LOC119589194 [Penaeus monodon]|uniref:uncharacterized protein LOC119589194 n=1 Tax=Penaeus monodon TaxID=6687 RepID=UPI0018A74E80|nr:uncharacterized protein LOC119589194 [Penaeus monodon]